MLQLLCDPRENNNIVDNYVEECARKALHLNRSLCISFTYWNAQPKYINDTQTIPSWIVKWFYTFSLNYFIEKISFARFGNQRKVRLFLLIASFWTVTSRNVREARRGRPMPKTQMQTFLRKTLFGIFIPEIWRKISFQFSAWTCRKLFRDCFVKCQEMIISKSFAFEVKGYSFK